jgi:hypothetical protein
MVIIFGVAAEAVAGRSREPAVGVTSLTPRQSVARLEGEIDDGMIEVPIRPFCRTVTEGAVPPEAALVIVVLRVAADAIARDPHPLAAGVAIEALELGMARFEGETRALVIDRGLLPRLRSMAFAALIAEPPHVDIVRSMAVDAERGGRLERGEGVNSEVTARARDLAVGAGERELGCVVVPLAPVGIHAVMALEACRAEGDHVLAGDLRMQ